MRPPLPRLVPALLVLAAALAGCGGSRPAATPDPTPAPVRRAPAPAPTAQAPAPAYVPGTDPETEAALRAAVAAYDAADFERAAAEFDAIAMRESAPRALRADALRYLGRTQIALGNEAAASETLRRLLVLEPPTIELDPDVEPPTLVRAYYEVRRAHDGDYRVRTDRPQTLAVADFTNSSITRHADFDPMRLGFASLMLHAMRGATELRLVERERLQWLLDEQALGEGEAGGRRAGELLGADRVVFGTYIVNGADLILAARVVDVETGEILLGERLNGRADDFDQLIEQLSLRVASAINVDLSDADVETGSLDAALSYSEGLALVEAGDYEGAYAKFNQALEYDPSYSRARERANSLRPLLASGG